MTPEFLARIVLQATFAACWAFIGVTSVFWPWWKSHLGWTITLLEAALGIVLLPAMLHYWLPGYRDLAWLSWLATIALCTVPPLIAWRAVVIYLYQRNGKGP